MPPPYLLDTDHCIAYLQASHSAHTSVSARVAAVFPGDLRVSLFSAMELAEGPWHSQTPQGFQKARSTLYTFLGSVPLIGITHLTIEEFGRVRADLRQRNQLIGDLDVAIAVTALTHGLTLVTHNTAHFSRIPGLVLEDWYP
jgi:tRNA(fMet)-specific endonuclease VapC